MLPVANRGAGQFIAFPDVCRTPPVGVPVPYVNVAFNAMASLFAPNVLTAMLPSLTVTSVIPTSIGDEPGVMHWTIKGAGVVVASFVNTFFNFLPAATLASLTTGNRANAPLGLIAVPSATNVFAMRAGAPASEGVEAAADLDRALAPDADRVSGHMLSPGVGKLDVRLFSLDVPARAHTLLRDLESQGMEALVIDLRGNPGGEIRAALELAGDFLEPGTLLATTLDEDGDATEHRARPGTPHRSPLVILVDRRTASAAELFAGCLRAHGRALLFGEPTYGKGAGTGLVPCRGSLRTVTLDVLLPDGHPISPEGLAVDVAWTAEAPA
jgi:carboxyl-terminal processing protease